ncbi:unnamed protein product [Effrenium voratum]|uniref:Uncharacterized protein n=1 Tax=Effrenium voratum TaxID=2562239 RepID=A0AA36J1K8_9DINO|nr:unnamed protein product [Effrenium voratum]
MEARVTEAVRANPCVFGASRAQELSSTIRGPAVLRQKSRSLLTATAAHCMQAMEQEAFSWQQPSNAVRGFAKAQLRQIPLLRMTASSLREEQSEIQAGHLVKTAQACATLEPLGRALSETISSSAVQHMRGRLPPRDISNTA